MNRSNYLGFSFIIFSFLMTSCSRTIPIVNDVNSYHQSPKGSYIEAKIKGRREKLNISGELLVADDKKIIVYTLTNPRIIQPYALKDILTYNLYFATGVENYDVRSSIINATTLTHGWFIILTLPINLIINGSINESVHKELRFDAKELPKDQLYKYARYPNGLPRGINLSNLDNLLEN